MRFRDWSRKARGRTTNELLHIFGAIFTSRLFANTKFLSPSNFKNCNCWLLLPPPVIFTPGGEEKKPSLSDWDVVFARSFLTLSFFLLFFAAWINTACFAWARREKKRDWKIMNNNQQPEKQHLTQTKSLRGNYRAIDAQLSPRPVLTSGLLNSAVEQSARLSPTVKKKGEKLFFVRSLSWSAKAPFNPQ